MSTTQGNAPRCQWEPVLGADGRVHMEMRWSGPAAAAVTPHAA